MGKLGQVRCLVALQASQKCIHSNSIPESLRRWHVKYKRKIEPPSKESNNLEVLQVLESHLEFLVSSCM